MTGDLNDRPWLLAIDTSAMSVSIALSPIGLEPGRPGAEALWLAGRNQTATLLGQIDALFRLVDIESSALGAVAVTVGPGSFNALRVGLSTAKAFSFAHDIPIFGVGTLDAAAYSCREYGLPVRAFVDAGRKRVVAGDYRWRNGRLQLTGDLEHRTRDELAEQLIEPTVLTGDLPDEIARELATRELVILPATSTRRRRAGILADIIYDRWLAGDSDDLASLEPIYVHSQPSRMRSGERSR